MLRDDILISLVCLVDVFFASRFIRICLRLNLDEVVKRGQMVASGPFNHVSYS